MNALAALPPLTASNAQDELEGAEKMLKAYVHKNQRARKKVDGEVQGSYRKAIEDRIQECKTLVEAPQSRPQAEGPSNGGRAGPEQAGAPSTEPQIDPTLQAPPAKKVRWERGQRHRKIETADPLEIIKESINAPMLARFVNSWFTYGDAVQSADPSSAAENFPDLNDAATDIIDQVLDTAQNSELSYEQFKWTLGAAQGALVASHLSVLHEWLVTNGLMIGTLQKKPAPGANKATKDVSAIRIMHEGKHVRMTLDIARDARINPSDYPGSVEAGMDAVLAVLTNRNDNKKCITCEHGPRGTAVESRSVPPPEDHPILDCKCPLRGAALELWMIKVTAALEGIPQRGVNGIKKSRLALNPDILKVIAGAIGVVSGHDIDTLLQPEADRLVHTIQWALRRLHSLNEYSAFSPSFGALSQKLTETLAAIDKEE